MSSGLRESSTNLLFNENEPVMAHPGELGDQGGRQRVVHLLAVGGRNVGSRVDTHVVLAVSDRAVGLEAHGPQLDFAFVERRSEPSSSANPLVFHASSSPRTGSSASARWTIESEFK